MSEVGLCVSVLWEELRALFPPREPLHVWEACVCEWRTLGTLRVILCPGSCEAEAAWGEGCSEGGPRWRPSPGPQARLVAGGTPCVSLGQAML